MASTLGGALLCQVCTRRVGFSRLTELVMHYKEKHGDMMSAEEDAMTVENLNAGLIRRQKRDAELSDIQEKISK